MKIHKLSLVAALALGSLLTCTSITSAQDTNQAKKGRGANIEQQMERLTTELKLTDAQKPKVQALLEDTQKKRQELRGVPQEERRDKMRGLMEEQNKKMKEILKPEQFTKYEELQKARRQRAQGGASTEKKADNTK